MTYRQIPLSEQVRSSPADATMLIINTYLSAGASFRVTAERLSISHRTLRRYVEKLGLAPSMNRTRERAAREGWLHNGRWPKKENATP